MAEGETGDELREQYLEDDPDLERILRDFELPEEATLARYIYLTEVARLKDAGPEQALGQVLRDHRLWLDSEGRQGRRADLSGAHLSYTELIHANLNRADLRGAELTNSNLSQSRLSRADLSSAKLTNSDLTQARLSRADLSSAKLTNANLTQADLSRADLRQADLSFTKLILAVLNRANLREADLSVANLGRADLSGASLRGANLSLTDLCRANLTGARDVTQEQLNDAFGDDETRLPEGFVIPRRPE